MRYETRSKFDVWMAKVDVAVEKACGLSSSDLADMDYLSMFEDGAAPSSAARAALRNEGWTPIRNGRAE